MLTASTVVGMVHAFDSFVPVSTGLAIFIGSALVGYLIARSKALFGRSL